MQKYIKVQGIKGVLVSVSSGARAFVAQESQPLKLDEETQQVVPFAEAIDGFKPTTVCVVMHRVYSKAVRKGQLKQFGKPTVAATAEDAMEKLKNATLTTPTGKKWTKTKDGREVLVADLKPSRGKAKKTAAGAPSGKGDSK